MYPIYFIMTTGRTGSDYLQACLDGVKGLLTFSGKFEYQNFLKKYKNIDNQELIEKFIDINLDIFKFNKIENINTDVDIIKFRRNFINLSKGIVISNKNFLFYLYKAYYLIKEKDLTEAKAIIHHTHGLKNTINCLKDFPEAKLLITIRDPRANLKSGLTNWFRYDESKIHMKHIFLYIKRIREDLKYVLSLPNKKMFIKLEDAGKIDTKKSLCDFLNIDYDKRIEVATLNSKIWNGDSLSVSKPNNGEFNREINNNGWQNYFLKKEIVFFNKIYSDYNIFGYSLPKGNFLDKLCMLGWVFKKFSFEKKTFFFNKNLYMKITNYYFFARRLIYTLKLIMFSK